MKALIERWAQAREVREAAESELEKSLREAQDIIDTPSPERTFYSAMYEDGIRGSRLRYAPFQDRDILNY